MSECRQPKQCWMMVECAGSILTGSCACVMHKDEFLVKRRQLDLLWANVAFHTLLFIPKAEMVVSMLVRPHQTLGLLGLSL